MVAFKVLDKGRSAITVLKVTSSNNFIFHLSDHTVNTDVLSGIPNTLKDKRTLEQVQKFLM